METVVFILLTFTVLGTMCLVETFSTVLPQSAGRTLTVTSILSGKYPVLANPIPGGPIFFGVSPEDERLILSRNPAIAAANSGLINDNSDAGKRKRQQGIRYLLRTKTGKYEPMARDGSNVTAGGHWITGGKVKIAIHGFSPEGRNTGEENIRGMHMFEVGDSYGQHANKTNVIVMDWTVLSTEPLQRYYEAAASTAYAGQDLAEFLVKIKSLGAFASWVDVHIQGFSLGAHVAGVAGAVVEKLAGTKVERITGLDPAGPLFEQIGKNVNKTRVLDSSDAKFVDIIHCNMGSIVTSYGGRLGSIVQAGHVDFYPDGGESQKTCSVVDDRTEACSHMKCPIYFAQSLTTYFLSCPCDSWETFKAGKCPCSRNDGKEQPMGESCSSKAPISTKYYRPM